MLKAKGILKNKRWRRFRTLNCIYAFIFGYFWVPCPLCNKKFGGHEWIGSLQTSPGGGVGVCCNCSEKAELLNKRWIPNADEAEARA